MTPPKEIIRVSQVEIRFLLDGDDTNGRISMFEVVVPPGAKVPAPHYHEHVDETMYGLDGVLTFTVEGKANSIGPGDRCFVPRGAVHHFINAGSEPSRTLVLLTPASIGPQYFRDMVAVLSGGGTPDPAKIAEVMRRHGLIVVPSGTR